MLDESLAEDVGRRHLEAGPAPSTMVLAVTASRTVPRRFMDS